MIKVKRAVRTALFFAARFTSNEKNTKFKCVKKYITRFTIDIYLKNPHI